MKIPEPIEVYLPRPSTARLKIVPHITEVQRPQRVKKITPTGTSTIPNPVPVNTGIAPITSVGAKMPTSTKISASEATNESCTLLEILPPSRPPSRRPHIIRNQ